MVTLEDIMEEIVGEIQDEFDHERPTIEQVNEMEYSIDGLMLIEEVSERFGIEMDRTDYDTIGGWLYSRVDAIPPEVGQTVEHNGYLFVIEETEQKRISRVQVVKLEMLVEEEGA